MIFTAESIARLVDISCVRSESSYSDIYEMVKIAKQYKFICVHTLPANVPYVKGLLNGNTDVLIGCPVGFPAGGNDVSVKVFEMERCIEMGAQEIDVVINIGWIISGRFMEAEKELAKVIKHAANIPIKTIIEVSLLSDEMIETASKIVLNAGSSFVKTGTGWIGRPTNYHHIQIIKRAIGNQIGIKASGGIRGLKMLSQMYKMGVTRFGIGASHAIDLINEVNEFPNGTEV